MNIVVLGMSPKSGDCWTKLFDTLDEGQAEGVVTYTVVDYWDAVNDNIEKFDGAIYCDVDVITENIPFFALKDCTYTEEEFFEFVDTVREYMEWKEQQVPVEEPVVPEKPKRVAKVKKPQPAPAPVEPGEPPSDDADTDEETAIPMNEISYEFTEDGIRKLFFKAITVVINGKDVRIDKEEFIELAKVCKLIDTLSYTVKNVIV